MAPNLAPQNADQWMRDMERRLTRLERAGQPNTSTPQRILLPGDPDASLDPANQPPLQIGDSAGLYMRFDNNEILTGSNGVASPLYLNPEGGDVRIGQNSNVSINLRLGSSGSNDQQPALWLSRQRATGSLVEGLLYQGGNDNPQTTLQLRKDGTALGNWTFRTADGTEPGTIASTLGGVSRHATMFATQVGQFTYTPNIASGAGVNQAVSFATGRFTQTPVVFCGSNDVRLTIDAEGTTTAGTTVRFFNWSPASTSGTSRTIWWLAVQMTNGNTNG